MLGVDAAIESSVTKSDLPLSADSEDHRSNRPVRLADVGSRDYRGEGRPCHLGEH